MGWDRYDDRVSQILEEAYQSGKSWVEFQVEGKADVYRADFVKMVQRNTTTGKERALRSLLALNIRDKVNPRNSQTVEINMPFSTYVRDLRKELAVYLKVPVCLNLCLRMYVVARALICSALRT
jgi:hypothetical protein